MPKILIGVILIHAGGQSNAAEQLGHDKGRERFASSVQASLLHNLFNNPQLNLYRGPE
jgi:hypothetical protein